MTQHELSDLMRRASIHLDAAASRRILDGALSGGARRRRARHLVAAGSAAAVLAVAATGVAVGVQGGPEATPAPAAVATSATQDPTPDVPTAPSTSSPTYAPGSETEVPGGPVIATDRSVVGDDRLAQVARDLLPEGVVDDLAVERTWSSSPTHMADRTRDGRAITFSFDGAAASVVLQRWDGYAAVGIEGPGAGAGPSLDEVLEDPVQKVATTAREACAGSYRSFPPVRCQEATQGWYSVARPSQGDAAPDSYRELTVTLYTPDGYVVTVDSYNTPGEKSGPPVADEPVLSPEESLAIAASPDWFR